MNSDLITTLKTYGFSDKEAKIYLIALELWASPASTIARQTWIKRVTVYTILKDLKSKWIVNSLEKKDTTYFSVVSPKVLLDILEQKFLAFKEKAPDLMALVEKIWSAPKIQYFEGSTWLEKLFFDFWNTKEDMRVIMWTSKKYKKFFSSQHILHYRSQRKKKWIMSKRILTADDVDIKKEALDDKKYGRKTLVVKDIPLPILADINIYWPWKVSILFFDKNDIPHIIIIENNEVYTTFLGIFEYIWTLNTVKNTNKNK